MLLKAPLVPFTVDAEAALPADVCLPAPSRRQGQGTAGLRGSSVVRAPTRTSVAFTATTRRADVLMLKDYLVAGGGGSLGGVGTPGLKLLDGFMMLEASGADLPEDAVRVSLESADLTGMVLQDVSYFSRLSVLNLGDNNLGSGGVDDVLSCLGTCLPCLVDLRLHCNGITRIAPIQGVTVPGRSADLGRVLFPRLEILDLSYNALDLDAISELPHAMPVLRELDLTCNALASVPDMVRRALMLLFAAAVAVALVVRVIVGAVVVSWA
jgi:hypothetical protein